MIFNGFSRGVKLVEVEDQGKVHDCIYNPEYGIKALSKPCDYTRGFMESSIEDLKGQGAQGVILGCTELPIAVPEAMLSGIDMIDPMSVLARKMIEVADSTKLLQK